MVLTRQQRFIKNVVNKYGKSEEDYLKQNDYPTHPQMDKFEKYNIDYDVDPALRGVTIELNNKGYKTMSSCQGHFKGSTGHVSIAISENEIPKKYQKFNTSFAVFMLKRSSEKDINVNEIKAIFKKYGIIITKYKPPVFVDKILPEHMFEFPAIVDKLPPMQVAYYYASNGKLETSYKVPAGRYIKMISYWTPEGNYSRMKLVDKGKVIWDKDLSARNKPYATLQIVRELQQAAYKALGMPFDFKKIMEEHNNKNKDSKPIKKIKRVRP
jgi:hypothetical protein